MERGKKRERNDYYYATTTTRSRIYIKWTVQCDGTLVPERDEARPMATRRYLENEGPSTF